MTDMDDPTQRELKQILHYDRGSGVFTWLSRPMDVFPSARTGKMWNTRYAGQQAGRVSVRGYVQISLGGAKYYAHVLAWLFEHGEYPGYPDFELDHIDHDKANNRIANLRRVGRTENARNLPPRQSRHFGLIRNKRRDVWTARIGHEGRRVNLGDFPTFEEALSARKAAEVRLGYHPNHARALKDGGRTND